jgi:hypothetical protein
VEAERPVPWFETRVRHSPGLGGFSSGGSNAAAPRVRRFGFFWKELPGCLGGEVMDAEAVAVFCSETFNSGLAIVRRGEGEARPACGAYASFSQLLPDRSGIDCTTMLSGRAPIVPTTLRYWRVSPARAVSLEATVSVAEPGRAFVGSAPSFYDERMSAYFMSATEDWAAPPDCALLTLEKGGLVTVAAAPELSRADCHDVALWSGKSGRRLLKAGERERPSP